MQYLKDEIKENIIKSALHEFREKGYTNASIRDIAMNAKMTSGNIYRYFDSKEALFDFIMRPVYEQLISSGEDFNNMVVSANVNYVNFDDMAFIREIYEELLKVFAEHSTELLILMDESEGTKYSGAKESVKQYTKEILILVYLEEFRRQGKIIKDDYIFYVVSSAYIEGICDILRKYTDGEKIRSLVETFTEMMFHDLSTRF